VGSVGIAVGPVGVVSGPGVTVGVGVLAVMHWPVSSAHISPEAQGVADKQQLPPEQLPLVQSFGTEHAPDFTGVERGVGLTVAVGVVPGLPELGVPGPGVNAWQMP
jgi:hypothetical protein